VLWMLFRGIEWGIYPPLIFLGIGALTDFGPLLARPRLILLGAAAQLGIFGALAMAILFGFTPQEAGAIGIIGGADGPTAIFVAIMLAPDLLGAIALSAYSYMALVPIIQPPIMRLLTTREERLIRMKPAAEAPKTLRIAFPIVGFLLTAFIANGALPLLGMLFFGNLLRESLVTDRLARTASTSFIDIVTILLGITVGAKTQAATFLTPQTLYIFVLGVVAFSVSTAGGVMFGKLMNKLSKEPVNPLIGAAGVSAVPMAARVVQKVANEEDPQNFLLMHAMGPNVAGVIGSAVAAGVLLSYFAG
jgi:sodium ion-translocating decarboxylase beta subunit